MDEDFYFEEHGNKKKYLTLTIVIVILIGIGLFLYNKYIFHIKSEVVYEVGDKISYDASTYVKNTILDKEKYKLILDEHLKIENDVIVKAGEYDFTLKYNGSTKKGKIIVKDTKAPDVQVKDLTVGLDEEFETSEFITVCNEYSKPCNVTYKKQSDEELYKKEGTHNVTLIIKDAYDNQVTKDVKLTVKKGYSLAQEKIKDLSIDHISPDYGDWDRKSYAVKYAKAFDSADVSNERFTYLYDMLEDDLSGYLPSGYEGSTIVDTEVINIYNKYNYIVGFAVRAELPNGKYIYLTNGE